MNVGRSHGRIHYAQLVNALRTYRICGVTLLTTKRDVTIIMTEPTRPPPRSATQERVRFVVVTLLMGITCNAMLLWKMGNQQRALSHIMWSSSPPSFVGTNTDGGAVEASSAVKGEVEQESTAVVMGKSRNADSLVQEQPPPQQTSKRSNTNTTTTRTTTTRRATTPSELFLTVHDLDRQTGEAYAAAWWQSVDRFRSTPVHRIAWLEDAVWKAIREPNKGLDLYLTRDWLDLSVEHLSKWWKTTRIDRFNAGYQRLLSNLFEYVGGWDSYRKQHESDKPQEENPWKSTISVVAYVPLSGREKRRMQPIDILVLGAQVISLLWHDAGRIVVVTDEVYMNYTATHIWPFLVDLLRNDPSAMYSSVNATDWSKHIMQNASQSSYVTNEVTIGSTELTLVGVQSEHVVKRKTIKLVPRAGLILLHDALFRHNATSEAQRRLVLGVHGGERWNYVYYTEQDSPLHTRTEILPDLKAVLDQGFILAPHRWTPVPHQNDFDDTVLARDLSPGRYLPAVGNWSHVTALDASDASCCDGGMRSRHGKLLYPKGNNFWYLDGFGRSLPDDASPQEVARIMAKRLERFSTYTLFRLKDGTGLTLAGAENARQCAWRPKRGCSRDPEGGALLESEAGKN